MAYIEDKCKKNPRMR